MTSPLRAVFFDLGGTLFSYRAVGRWTAPTLVEAARRLGIEAEPRELGKAYSRASHRANLDYVDRPYYLHRDLFRDTIRGFAGEFELEAPEDWVDEFETSLRTALVENMELRDDCLSTLRELRRRGLQTAIVSNIDDDHLLPMVERSGLAELLDHWTSSEEARSCKPDPEFFYRALEKGQCRAEDVLFVGDSPEHDIQGARAVGMTTALIHEPGSTPLLQTGRVTIEAHHRIETLSELLAVVGESSA